MEELYLKGNVQIEPLVLRWHAYPFLIAPSTAAKVISNYQLPIMESYLKMPMAHVAALKNPEMVGGPFIDYGGKRLDEIRDLKAFIEEKGEGLIQLSKGLQAALELLKSKGKGLPLESLYEEIPEAARGCLELVYDLDHHSSFRLIEKLLYAGPLYDPDVQSLSLSLIDSDDRPFIFSTPRLASEENVTIDVAFDSEEVDFLGELKRVPKPIEEIFETLSIKEEDRPRFQQFLTNEAPKHAPGFEGEGVRIRYFGHACVLIETAAGTILTDPLISYKYPTDLPRFTYEDLPDVIDCVVITHAHHDHIVLETLLQLRKQIRKIVVPSAHRGVLQDPSMKLVLENTGFSNVVEISDMDVVEVNGMKITGVPFYGEHCDLDIASKSVYVIECPDQTKIMVAADSSSINPTVYERVHDITGDIDVLFVGLECTGAPMSWAYGPLFDKPIEKSIDQVRRSKGSDYVTAKSLIDIFQPDQVYLYAMGLEPWLNYFMALQHGHSENANGETDKVLEECKRLGITAEKLFASKEILVHEKNPAALAY